MSTSLRSVNNIMQTDDITFTVNFPRRGHSGISFAINDKLFTPYIKDPGFMCTEEADASSVTQTLEVQYHCIAVKQGRYRIEANVYYCGRDYFTQTFTVVVENGKYFMI